MGTSIILLPYSKVNLGNYCDYDQIMSDNRKLIGVHKLSTELQSSLISDFIPWFGSSPSVYLVVRVVIETNVYFKSLGNVRVRGFQKFPEKMMS